MECGSELSQIWTAFNVIPNPDLAGSVEVSAMCSTRRSGHGTRGSFAGPPPLPESRPGHRARGRRTSSAQRGVRTRAGLSDRRVTSSGLHTASDELTTRCWTTRRRNSSMHRRSGSVHAHVERSVFGDCRMVRRVGRRRPSRRGARYLSRLQYRSSPFCGTATNGRYRALLRPAHGFRRPHAMRGRSRLARLIRAR